MSDGALRALTFRALTHARGWRRWLAAFAAGAAGALAQAPTYLFPLLFLSFAGFVLLLDGAAEAARPRRAAFAVGWWFGLGYFLLGLYWMAFSFFVQADDFAWMAPFAMLGMPSFLALFYGGAAALAIGWWRAGPSRVALFAGVFMAFEYARGHVLTGLPWNLPGQAFAVSGALSQAAAWVGAYGLSLAAVLTACAPALFTTRERDAGRTMLRGLGLGLVGVLALFAVGHARLALARPASSAADERPAFVRIVQPNVPQREKIDPTLWRRNVQRTIDLSAGPMEGAPANARLFVVWPENAAALLDEAPEAIASIDAALPPRATLIAGAVRRERVAGRERPRYFNAVLLLAPGADGRQVVGAYDKHHLVPFGEYLPLSGFLRAVGLAQLAPFEEGFSKGPGPRVLELEGSRFAPLVCYEAIFPNELHPATDRPDWLVTVTNDAWFGDTSGPRQHLDQARLRSIETGLPMARAANTGVSALIDAKGRYLARLKLYEPGVIDFPLPPPLGPTLYARLGDGPFFVLLALTLAVGFGAHRWRPPKRG
ncbi:MAG: apolipoprotein N-acyltransferase [Parvularculaceae bacterium]